MTEMRSDARDPGPVNLKAGVSSVFQAITFLAERPKSWVYALTPIVIALTIQAGLVLLAWKYSAPIQAWFSGWAYESISGLLAAVARTALVLLAAWGAYFVACLLAPPLSAPALEALVSMQEVALGAPPRPSSHFARELWCGLKAASTAVLLFAPPALLLWLVGWVVPVLGPVIALLEFLLLSLAIAYNLLDYPLTLRGVGIRARLGILSAHLGACLGFGASFAALFAIPCFGILMLPVGVVAATRLHWRIDQLPEEPRGAAQ